VLFPPLKLWLEGLLREVPVESEGTGTYCDECVFYEFNDDVISWSASLEIPLD
jgi:hypothetical protein